MLTEERIDELVEIVGTRYDDLQDMLMSDIVKKVRQGLDIGASIQWNAKKYLELGGAWEKDVASKIQKVTGLAQKDVEKLLKDAGLESIREDNRYLPKDHKLAEKLSAVQLRVIKAGIKNVNGQIGNMANITLGSTLDIYSDLVTKGYDMMATGSYTLDQAMEKVGTDLVREGVKGIQYPSGRKDRIEVAVRRALRTGTNQTMLKLGEENAMMAGTDLVEVSAHAGARPEHALWQGKVYSLSGKTKGYRKLSEATGYGSITGLGGVNCRHSFHPFYPDFSEREYTDKELKAINKETVLVDGKEVPMYQATQMMRGLERRYRDQRRLSLFAGKNTADKQIALKAKMRSLSKQTGISINPGRLRVYGEKLPAGMKPSNPYSTGAKNKALKYTRENKVEGITKLTEQSAPFWNKLSLEQKTALSYYTSDGYADLNANLNGWTDGYMEYKGVGKVDFSKQNAAMRDAITSALDSVTGNPAIWVDRGVDIGQVLSIFQDEAVLPHATRLDALKKHVGDMFELPSFVSTTMYSGGGFSGDMIFHIYCPENSKWLYLNTFTDSTEFFDKPWTKGSRIPTTNTEAEVLLQRGAKYVVTDVKGDRSKIEVFLELHLEEGYNLRK